MNKDSADIVVGDNSIGNFSVCKSDKGKSIAISSYDSDFDFTIYNNPNLSF